MELRQPPLLEMPSFLFGPSAVVHRKAMREGKRCAGKYRKDGSFPLPRELLEVPRGEVVIACGGVDFVRSQPAWRLHMVASVIDGLCKALEWKDMRHVCDLYESFARETVWGALYFAVSHIAPMDAARVGLRLEAMFRFWDSLQSARYLFSSPSALLSLDELMKDACDWVVTAWCPEGGESIRFCLKVAAERMARATKEDCIDAILRQLVVVLPYALARGLKHPDVFSSPRLWRERLATLAPDAFARISSAWPANVLERLYLWDKQLGAH
jgi:hypothetical protein